MKATFVQLRKVGNIDEFQEVCNRSPLTQEVPDGTLCFRYVDVAFTRVYPRESTTLIGEGRIADPSPWYFCDASVVIACKVTGAIRHRKTVADAIARGDQATVIVAVATGSSEAREVFDHHGTEFLRRDGALQAA